MRKIKQCFFYEERKRRSVRLSQGAIDTQLWPQLVGKETICFRMHDCVCVLFNNCVHFNIRGITAGTLCPNPIFKNCHLSVHFCVGIETVLRILSTTNFRQTNCHLSRCFQKILSKPIDKMVSNEQMLIFTISGK